MSSRPRRSKPNLFSNLHLMTPWQSSCIEQLAGKLQEKPAEFKEHDLSKSYSWFRLITFCATPALAVALGLAVVLAGAALAFAAPAKPAATQESNKARRVFAGLITDDRCGARHDMDSGKSTTECTRMCVRNGSKYVLVEGDKKYDLAGSDSDLEGLAGQRVKVIGSLDRNTIKVDSISSGQ
jgi:hypothetical protein